MLARGQQQPTGPQTSYSDQQPGTSRQLHFTFSPSKVFNTLSVASVTGKESACIISGFSSIFGNIQSVMSYPQMDTPQLLTVKKWPSAHINTSSLLQPPSSKNLLSQAPPAVIRAQASGSRLTPPAYTKGPFQDHCCKMSFSGQLLICRSFSGPPKSSQNNYSAEFLKKF